MIRSPSPEPRVADHGQAHDRLRLPGVRRAVAEVARALRRLRRVELARRGARRRGGGAPAGRRTATRRRGAPARLGSTPTIAIEQHARLSTGIGEFDRVLGGGIVPGLARAARRRAGHRQVDAAAAGRREHGADRSARCSTAPARSPSTRSSRAASGSASATRRSICSPKPASSASSRRSPRLKPALVIVDSIQTVFSLKFQSAPGSIGQVREAATQLLFIAKGQNVPTFLVGHVTKDGSLAGPEGARARRRHRAVLRRRAPSLAPRRARRQEPLRRRQRARRLRDDRGRPAAGAESVEAVPRRAAGRTRPGRRCCARSRARGRSSSRCRRSSAPAPTAPRGGWPAASISSGCRCCSPCSRSAPAST